MDAGGGGDSTELEHVCFEVNPKTAIEREVNSFTDPRHPWRITRNIVPFTIHVRFNVKRFAQASQDL